MEPLLDKFARLISVRMVFHSSPNGPTKLGINWRFAIVTFLSGFLALLLSFWALNAAVLLRHPNQNWGELGFVATTILESFFISLGYILSFLLIYLPWTFIKHRKHLSKKRFIEAIIGGIVFGIMVLVFSSVVTECVMGGSFSDIFTDFSGLLTELFVDIFTNNIWWLIPFLIPAMISGLVTFALAAHRAKL